MGAQLGCLYSGYTLVRYGCVPTVVEHAACPVSHGCAPNHTSRATLGPHHGPCYAAAWEHGNGFSCPPCCLPGQSVVHVINKVLLPPANETATWGIPL